MQPLDAFPSNPAFNKRAIKVISEWASSPSQSRDLEITGESPIRWNRPGQPPKNWLGSPAVLRRILADFVVGCLERHPDLTPRCLAEEDDAAAMRIAGIVLGMDSNFVAVEGWNEVGRIDRHLENIMSGGAFDARRSVAEFFKTAVMMVSNAGMVFGMGGAAANSCEFMLVNQLDTFIAFLLGVGVPEEE